MLQSFKRKWCYNTKCNLQSRFAKTFFEKSAILTYENILNEADNLFFTDCLLHQNLNAIAQQNDDIKILRFNRYIRNDNVDETCEFFNSSVYKRNAYSIENHQNKYLNRNMTDSNHRDI